MLRGLNLMKGVLLGTCFCGCFAFSAHAQSVGQLTEDNVREFIEKTTSITAGRESDMSQKQIEIYLDVHIHDDARFKSTMRYAIPGFDVQEKTMSVDKNDFIKSIHAATDTVSDYENIIEITDIQISKDGRKATVQTRMYESGKMPVADDIEKEEVPIEGMSTCTQVIMLDKKNMIQMYNANCVTDIHFNTFSP